MPKDIPISSKSSLPREACVLTTYQDVLNEITALSPPPVGFTRVFRGQTGNLGKMLPSGLRDKRLRNEEILRRYCHILADDLLGQLAERHDSDDLYIWAFWAHAIVQHYGPGSKFLDVTRSLDVALWFALHALENVSTHHIIGPPGHANPGRDITTTMPWVRYQPWTGAPGWLYVFDVPEGGSQPHPSHGALLDLADAPPAFASSARIRAQAGCLLVADSTINGGDLSARYACAPLPVMWPPTDAPETVSAPTEALFPVPSQDPWYERLLGIPLVCQLDPATRRVVLERAVPVSIHRPEDPHQIADIARRIIAVEPVRLFPTAIREFSAAVAGSLPAWATTARLENATPIMLESPLIFATPPVDSVSWNQGLLSGELPDIVDVFDATEDVPAGAVTVTNVFIEFSPLERAGWERVERPGVDMEILRAVWLVRDGTRAVMYRFSQAWPDGHVSVLGPLPIAFDPITARFGIETTHGISDLVDSDAFHPVAKPLFLALTLLRELSPVVKASPIPELVAKSKDGWDIIVDVRGTAARLVRARDDHWGDDWYFLWDVEHDEPFTSPHQRLYVVQITADTPWS